MSWKNTTHRYGSVAIATHWLMLVLLAAVYAAIELHEAAPKGSVARAQLETWHGMLGLSVFVLVVARLAVRGLSGPAPVVEPGVAHWQLRAARFAHAALYAFMFAMPLLGWLALSADGKPVAFFGLELPALLAPNAGVAHTLEELHETVGVLGYFLIGLHAAAALVHHYVLRDDTLARMLPAAARRATSSAIAGARGIRANERSS